METIYGEYKQAIESVERGFLTRMEALDKACFEERGEHLYEHISARIKTDESMRAKCKSRNLPETAYSALVELKDAIGVRIVCSFMDDIYEIIERIRHFENCRIVEEKDYIRHTKPNGYRSYHLILEMTGEFADVNGNRPGHFYVEVQLRTIVMDSWAALEHKMKYKKNIKNQAMIEAELKRCADELASCDLSMQTIRELIRNSD